MKRSGHKCNVLQPRSEKSGFNLYFSWRNICFKAARHLGSSSMNTWRQIKYPAIKMPPACFNVLRLSKQEIKKAVSVWRDTCVETVGGRIWISLLNCTSATLLKMISGFYFTVNCHVCVRVNHWHSSGLCTKPLPVSQGKWDSIGQIWNVERPGKRLQSDLTNKYLRGKRT